MKSWLYLLRSEVKIELNFEIQKHVFMELEMTSSLCAFVGLRIFEIILWTLMLMKGNDNSSAQVVCVRHTENHLNDCFL